MANTITQTVVNQVIKAINEMDCTELVMLNNEYCESINGMDSMIYSNDDNFLEDYFNSKSDLARAISYGDYRYMDNWVTFNGYGNLESFNYMDTDKLCELVEVMAEYIVDTFQDFSQFDNIDFHL
jgi:hypothetical protein